MCDGGIGGFFGFVLFVVDLLLFFWFCLFVVWFFIYPFSYCFRLPSLSIHPPIRSFILPPIAFSFRLYPSTSEM